MRNRSIRGVGLWCLLTGDREQYLATMVNAEHISLEEAIGDWNDFRFILGQGINDIVVEWLERGGHGSIK
jgi:hypothetical protein